MKQLGGIFIMILLFFGVAMIMFFGLNMMAGVDEPNETLYPEEAEAYGLGIGMFNIMTPAVALVILFLVVCAAGMAVWFLLAGGGKRSRW